MAISNTTLTSTSPTTVFQAAGQQAITVMYICNTGNVDVSCNVYCANSGSSSSTDNMIYNQLLITAGNVDPNSGDTYVISTEKLILDNGDFVDVEANVANVITVTVSSIAV